jgi:hypothetical protein
MIAPAYSGAFVATLLFTAMAVAGEPPAPRPPIGPRAIETAPVLEMLPDPRDPLAQKSQPLAEDRIRIVNIGNQNLFIAYWDGDSAWKQAAIDAGRATEVSCPKCAGTITVAFHNGRENKSLKVKGGGTYLLGWSAQAGAWVLTGR